MATIINADTSDGLKLTSDTSGEIELQSAGVTKAKITSSGLQNASGSPITSQAGKNLIINGDMAINQRGVTGTVSLSAGAYGHDRFKAGAAGATYTFATTANVTTITITAGSLQQVVEGLNIQSGTHTLSWTGTAQGKIDAGSYSASGVTGTLTGGTNATVEFNTGTLTNVQLEEGTTATPFEHLQYGQQLALCQRYYERSGANPTDSYSVSDSSNNTVVVIHHRVTKRVTGTLHCSGSARGSRDGNWNYIRSGIAYTAGSCTPYRMNIEKLSFYVNIGATYAACNLYGWWEVDSEL